MLTGLAARGPESFFAKSVFAFSEITVNRIKICAAQKIIVILLRFQKANPCRSSFNGLAGRGPESFLQNRFLFFL